MRTETEAVGEGPYRSSSRSTTIIEAKRRVRSDVVAYAVIGVALVTAVEAAIVGNWWKVFLLLVAIVAATMGTRKMSRERVLTIGDDHLQLTDGKRLLLDDVRKVAVVRRFDLRLDRDVACVIVHTPDAEVEIARVDEREQAEYVERLVDEAYRAYLRRPR